MKKILSITFIFFIVHSVLAQNQEVDTNAVSVDTQGSLFDLSLNELVNLKVTVVSKREELTSEAPGMVTSYSAKDIEDYGYYNLSDLASITSGYSSFKTFGEKVFETRGQKADGFDNNKHLVLYDGIPINHARAYSAGMDNQLPLFGASQVTFLKGPGSALYGTSAFYGVIDVQTKKLSSIGSSMESKLSFGSYNRERRIMANAFVKKENGEMSIVVGAYGRDASKDFLGANNIKDDTHLKWDDESSMFLNSTYEVSKGKAKGLKSGLIFMRKMGHGGDYWTEGLDSANSTNPTNYVVWTELIPYLKYKKELTEKLNLSTYLLYNNSTEESNYVFPWGAPITRGFSYTFGNIQWNGELDYEVHEKHHLIGGLFYDWRAQLANGVSYEWGTTVNYLDSTARADYDLELTPVEDLNTAAVFGQYQGEFDVLEGLNLTIGARYDNGWSETNKYTQVSPRVGVVQKLTNSVIFKFLYGQAMRAPGVKEVGINPDVQREIKENGGDATVVPDFLSPESIRTIELGMTFLPRKWNISIALFNNQTINAYERVAHVYSDGKNGPAYFVNTNGIVSSKGLEFDAVFAPNRSLKVFANYAFAESNIADTIKVNQVPDHKINLGVSYRFPIIRFPMTVSVISKNAVNYHVHSSGYGGNSTVPGYNFLDANLLFPLTEEIGIELQVRNVLDQQWHQPSIKSNEKFDVLYLGRTFLFTLSAKL